MTGGCVVGGATDVAGAVGGVLTTATALVTGADVGVIVGVVVGVGGGVVVALTAVVVGGGASVVEAAPSAEFFVRASADSPSDPPQAAVMTMKKPRVIPARRFIVLPTR